MARLGKDWLKPSRQTPKWQIANFDPAAMGPSFETEEVSTTVTTVPMLVLPPSPSRVIVRFFQPNFAIVTPVAVAWGDGNNGDRFMVIPDSRGLEFKYADYGAMVGYGWYAIGMGANPLLAIWSVKYVPM